MVNTFFREPQRVSYLQNEICSLRAETMSHASLPWPLPNMWSAGQQVLPGRGTCDSCSACPSFGTFWKRRSSVEGSVVMGKGGWMGGARGV